jgi:hypothetical protein
LEHEFFHYLFFRPSITFSGFIVEGEATAYGEYEHQMLATGVHSDNEMGDLFLKTIVPNGATSKETERLNKLVEANTRSSSPTAVQCECASAVYHANIVTKIPIPLARLLTLSTPLFQSGSNDVIGTRYGQAWAVYHVDLLLQKGWGQQLEVIAAKLHARGALSDEDSVMLSRVSHDTLDWVGSFTKGRKKECENILRSGSFPGKQ